MADPIPPSAAQQTGGGQDRQNPTAQPAGAPPAQNTSQDNPYEQAIADAEAWLQANRDLVGHNYDALTQVVNTPIPLYDVDPVTGKKTPRVDHDGNPIMGPDTAAIAAMQKAVDSSKALYAQYQKAEQDAIRNSNAWIKANNKSLTPSQQAALDSRATIASYNADAAESNAAAAASRASAAQAQAALKLDPGNQALIAAAKQAEIDAKTAQTNLDKANLTAQNFTNDQNAKYGDQLAQLGIASKGLANRTDAAKASSAESQAAVDAVNADYASSLAALNLQMQQKNLDFQEYANQKAKLDNDTQQKLIALGVPEATAKKAIADANLSETTAKQTQQGDAWTLVDQLKAAIANGSMTADAANLRMNNFLQGSSPLERKQETDNAAISLAGKALDAGIAVGAGQTSADPNGVMRQAFGKVGINLPDQPLQSQSLPQWAQGMGVNLNPEANSVQTFDQQGNLIQAGQSAPAWMAGGSSPDTALAMGPDEYAAMLAGQKGAAAPGTPATQAQASVAPPDASGDTLVPITGQPGAYNQAWQAQQAAQNAPTVHITVNAAPQGTGAPTSAPAAPPAAAAPPSGPVPPSPPPNPTPQGPQDPGGVQPGYQAPPAVPPIPVLWTPGGKVPSWWHMPPPVNPFPNNPMNHPLHG